MCGILCYIYQNCKHATDDFELSNELGKLNENVNRRGCDCSESWRGLILKNWISYFNVSVLRTQGIETQTQPFINGEDILLWNGDIFGSSEKYDEGTCDTVFISNWLKGNSNNVIELVSRVRGPYSFVFWDSIGSILWFGRDIVGRHSLLWNFSKAQIFLTSVAYKSDICFEEVPAIGIFALHFYEGSDTYDVTLYPWTHCESRVLKYNLPASITNVMQIKTPIPSFNFDNPSWFSISYDGDTSIYQQFQNIQYIEPFMNLLLANKDINGAMHNFLHYLSKSIQIRVNVCPDICRDCRVPCNHTKIGILFSGGLDSTIIALLADKYLPTNASIDLLNVAFNTTNGSFNVPDRITGLSSIQEIVKLCPNRTWNFITIDVSKEELNELRINHICHLIYPLETVLDDSLGCALWFAARGKGLLNGSFHESTARILLSGMGADEQLGGYARHRTVLKNKGWAAFGTQLIDETISIWKRNLGRDDRVISDHGRQPRFPFLDENVIQFLMETPPWHRCGTINLPVGVGDKLLLRLIGWHLGLRNCALLPKRAMQFGSRIANKKEKGNNVSHRL